MDKIKNSFHCFCSNLFDSYDEMVETLREGDDFMVYRSVTIEASFIILTDIINADYEVHYVLINNYFYYFVVSSGKYMIFLMREE